MRLKIYEGKNWIIMLQIPLGNNTCFQDATGESKTKQRAAVNSEIFTPDMTTLQQLFVVLGGIARKLREKRSILWSLTGRGTKQYDDGTNISNLAFFSIKWNIPRPSDSVLIVAIAVMLHYLFEIISASDLKKYIDYFLYACPN